MAGRWSSGVPRPRSGGHNRLSRWTISLRVAGGGVVSLVLLLMASPARAIQAQVPRQDRIGGWSEARQIPNYNDLLAAPFLVADQNHMVHAFNIELSGDQVYSVMYRRWSLAQGWSSPVDVLLPGYFGLAPSLGGVFLDHQGMVHLVYFAGGQSGSSYYYSRAHVSEIDQARAWSTPEPVAPDAGTIGTAAITGNGEGELVIAYGGRLRGRGLYEVRSEDGGNTWSGPALVSPMRTQDLWPGAIWLEDGGDGQIFAVWDTVNSRGLREEVRYGRYDPALRGWTDIAVLAGVDSDQELLGAPSIIKNGNELIVFYQDDFPPTKFVRRSIDGGRTWSAPVRPFPHIGGYGYAFLVRDSAGTIHLVVGNRLPDPEIHGMWHSQLVGSQWLPLEPIISGPAGPSFDPSSPTAVISQGNVLLATWSNNVRRESSTGAWYSYAILDAPELPVFVPPTLQPSEATASPGPSGTAATRQSSEASTAAPAAIIDLEAGPTASPNGPLFWGVFPVALLLLLMLIGRSARRPTPPQTKPSEDLGGERDMPR